MGHPVLLLRAQQVPDPAAPEIQRLIANMTETLDDAGGVGLAAPQIHVSQRLFIYTIPASRAEGGVEIPLTAIINPDITPLTDEISLFWEGCLSIPGLRGAIPRHQHIRLTAQDATGARIEKTLSGFEARVVQHETDHLNGILYPMRMTDFRYFGFTEETLRYDFPLPKVKAAL